MNTKELQALKKKFEELSAAITAMNVELESCEFTNWIRMSSLDDVGGEIDDAIEDSIAKDES